MTLKINKMATKKKTSTALNPILDFSAGLPNNVNQILSQIPTYDDVGVSFKGFSKTAINGNEYRTNKQTTRFYSCLIPTGSAAGTYTFNRINLPEKFYASNCQIDISTGTSPTNIIVYDGVVANPRMKIVAGANEFHYSINFNAAKEFSGTQILINIDAQVSPIGGFIHLCFYGWQE